MNKKQALALLQLIADCYSVLNAPEPVVSHEHVPAPAAAANGKGRARETQSVAND